MIVRQARLEEVEAIRALFADEVRAGRMLPRSPEDIRAHIADWLVAESFGHIIGCVSLVYYNQGLCEVRSLAVHPRHRGNGVAGMLIEAALHMAQEQNMSRVLALTRVPQVFERAGFQRDYIAHYPEKVWRDCTPCPFREACDEVALIFELQHEKAELLHERG